MLYKIIALHGDLNKKTTSISYIHLGETAGKWSFEQKNYKKIEIGFSSTIHHILQMPITTFQQLNKEVSLKLSTEILNFIKEQELQHKIDFIACDGLKINDNTHFGELAVFAANIMLPIIGDFHSMNAILKGTPDIYHIANDLLSINANDNDEQKNISIALLAALRWREANNILHKHTKATKDHIAGAIWLGVEA